MSLQLLKKVVLRVLLKSHNPCFSRNVFAIQKQTTYNYCFSVTILVLVEMSLQYHKVELMQNKLNCHNPCFSRNVFAIIQTRNQKHCFKRHNPCFSRNVFAIINYNLITYQIIKSQSLF